jgi:RAB protein geranylgeranyltransferase component A
MGYLKNPHYGEPQGELRLFTEAHTTFPKRPSTAQFMGIYFIAKSIKAQRSRSNAFNYDCSPTTVLCLGKFLKIIAKVDVI